MTVERIEAGRVFADRLHRLALDHDPRARHLSCRPSLGVVADYGVPVVVRDDMPPDLAWLIKRDGTTRAYTIDEC